MRKSRRDCGGMVSFQLTKMSGIEDDPELEEWRAVLRYLIASVERRGLPYKLHDHVWAEPRADAITIQSHQYGRGLNLWHVKKSYLPGYVYFDRCGYSGWAEIADSSVMFDESQSVSPKQADHFFRYLQQEYAAKHQSKWAQSDVPFVVPAKPYIFYALQRPSDTVQRLARVDWRTLLDGLATYAQKHDICLVVKRHPRCDEAMVEEALQALKDHPHVQRTEASIHAVIPGAAAVFVINSGVGFESLMHLKPVFTAGKSDYHWVTHRIETPEQIIQIPWPMKLPVNEMAIKKFLYYFCCHYLVDVRDGRRTDEMIAIALREYRRARNPVRAAIMRFMRLLKSVSPDSQG